MEDNFAMGYALGQDSGNCHNGNGNGGGFGFDGGWGGLLGLIVVASLFGFGGMGGGNRGGAPWATQEDVRAAVDQQTLISKLDQQTYGLADTFTALNNTLNNNFRGIDSAICNLGFNTQQGFNNLSHQMSTCCCDLEKMNMQNRFDAQTANCNTLQAIDKLGDRILGYLTNKEAQDLRDEVQGYRLAASQAKQNQYLIDQLRPCPVPAYLTCNPYAASYGFGYGGNNGCGCNSCGC